MDFLRKPLELLRKARKTPVPDAVAPQALQLDLFAGPARAAPPDAPAAGAPPAVAVPPLPVPPAADLPAGPGQRQVQLGQHLLQYRLRRSTRRTIGFLIDEAGLRVTAPKWVGMGEIEDAIREKQRWILAKLHAQHDRAGRQLQPPMQWCDGARLPYLGSHVTLRLMATASAGVTHDAAAATLTICLPAGASQQQLKDRVQAWLQQEAKTVFAARLPVYAARLDVSYRAFALSSATTQWGSCTADGRIRLNWRLIHFSLPLIDYVIAHELSHLREMNHGPRFWATVQSVFPEFIAAKKALRDQAPQTLPVF